MAIIADSPENNGILKGTRGDDEISGIDGNDVIRGGAGNDIIDGGSGQDLLFGGVGADKFVFTANDVTSFGTDYIADFSLKQGDTLEFLSPNTEVQTLVVDSVFRTKVEIGDINGADAQNNAAGWDVVFTIRNTETGETQDVVLLDSWSSSQAGQWDDFLASMGLSWDLGPVLS